MTYYWEFAAVHECPMCREESSLDDLRPNHTLSSIVETFLAQQTCSATKNSVTLCRSHGEKFILYCLDDKKLICAICQSSQMHVDHKTCPIQEAAEDFKEKLRNVTQFKLEKFYEVKETYDLILEEIQNQSQTTEKQIKNEFEKLHQFLYTTEEIFISNLKKEEEQKIHAVAEKIRNLNKNISDFTDKLEQLREDCEQDDTDILMDSEAIQERSFASPEVPEVENGTLIDVTKHLENLQYKVWKNMLDIIKPVPFTLNPNTASQWLEISDDLTAVMFSNRKQMPDNPERFKHYDCVLGSQGFSSGKHSWEVKVGNSLNWDIGVAKETINKKKEIPYSPENGFWTISLVNGLNYKGCDGSTLLLSCEPLTIRVSLDFDEGKLSFCNADDGLMFYTCHEQFKEEVFPFFYVGSCEEDVEYEPLEICPLKVSIQEM